MSQSRRAPTAPRNGKPVPALPPAPLEPFKIVGQLIGTRHDENGAVVAEVVMGDVVIYRSQFGELEQLVDAAVERAQEQQQ